MIMSEYSFLRRRSLEILTIALSLSGCDGPEGPIAELEHGDHFDHPATSALVDGRGPVAQRPGFDLDIAADDGDVVVLWASQGGTGSTYTVWRGSDPYYEPGDPDSIVLMQGLEQTIFVDPGADLDDEPYYYRVTVEDDSGAASTTVGKYVHTVQFGYNKISQPLITEVTDAQALSEDLPSMFSALSWFAPGQYWRGWNIDANFAPFSFSPGEVVVVMPQWGTDTTYHQYGAVPDVDELQLALSVGDNAVTVPLSYGDTTAEELLGSVPGVVEVGRWDADLQQVQTLSVNGGDDFDVPAGSAVHLVVTAESVWPGP